MYLARTSCVPLVMLLLIGLEANFKGLLDCRGRLGITSVVRWNSVSTKTDMGPHSPLRSLHCNSTGAIGIRSCKAVVQGEIKHSPNLCRLRPLEAKGNWPFEVLYESTVFPHQDIGGKM